MFPSAYTVTACAQSLSTLTMTTSFETVWHGMVKYITNKSVPQLYFMVYHLVPERLHISVVPCMDHFGSREEKNVTVARVMDALGNIGSEPQDVMTILGRALKVCLGMEPPSKDWVTMTRPGMISKHKRYPVEIMFTGSGSGFDAGPRVTACDDPSMVRGLEACITRYVSQPPRARSDSWCPKEYEQELTTELQSYRPLTEAQAAALDGERSPKRQRLS